MTPSAFKRTFFCAAFKKNLGAFASGHFLIVVEFFAHLSCLVNTKIDSVRSSSFARASVSGVFTDKENECTGCEMKETSDLEPGLLGDLWSKREKFLGRMNHSRPGKR